MRFVWLTLPLLVGATVPVRAALDRAEQRVVAAVAADQEPAVALLERLVNQNSGTRNFAGVTRVGEMMRPELEALGFVVRWQPMANSTSNAPDASRRRREILRPLAKDADLD